MDFDYQDLANLHQKLDNINNSIRATNPNNSSSSSGPILETSTKLILFPIILGVLFVYSIISFIGAVILMGLSAILGEELTELLLVFGFFVFILAAVITIKVIVKKRKKKIAKQKARQKMNGEDVYISPEQMAEYQRFFDEACQKEMQESLKRSQEKFREKNG